MTDRDWHESTYTPLLLTSEQQLARAHRLAAIRNPAKATQHNLSAELLTPASGAPPSDDYEARVKAWKHAGGDWTPFSKSKDQSK
jgi:hypothetical protein